MKLSKNYVENVYLREEFTTEQATVDRFWLSRALQNKFSEDKYGRNESYSFYKKESTRLLLAFQLNKISFPKLVDELCNLRLETILKYPTSFRIDTKGWYDLRRMSEKDEKERWLATPIDRNLIYKAKKEGRVSVIVNR